MAFVVDTSVTMAWCFEDESTEQTEAVLERLRHETAVVPALWQLEVANVLVVAERRGRLKEAQAAHFLGLLERLRIELDPAPGDTHAIIAAARRHGLSAYDAAYLVLAERLALPLATLDDPLRTACHSAGVPVLGQ